jgi:CubicO group peptidase (beta-lactamase class C family)
MKPNFKPGLLFLIVFLVTAAAMAQSRIEALNHYFSTLSKNGDFNGNVLIADNGKIVYEKSFGYADFPAGKLNNLNTAFPVASITKTITSTAILQLREKGKLQISDPYIKYFPAFPYPSVTIRQLLSHTSRIPSSAFYRFLDSLRIVKDTFFTNADVIPAFIALNKPLLGEAKPEGDRSTFAYSNINYYLLALLIEKLTGMPYNSYVKKYIFLPAGMESSSLAEFNAGMDKNICKEHRYRYLYSAIPERIDTVAENQYIFKTFNFKGHGDVVSTIQDLLKYDKALYNGTLLHESSLQLAYQPVVPGTPNSSGYGLGWSIPHDSSKGKIVFHHGGGLGIEAMLVRNISKHQTVILVDNSKNPAFYVAMNALKILNGEKIPPPKRSIAKRYGRVLVKEGIAEAGNLLKQLKQDTLNYALSEYEMNLLGYQLMGNGMDDLAFEVFKTDIALFPKSWNVYDSYGEILLKLARKDEAIKMYQKSIELNPENENGKKVLLSLQKK